MSYTYKGLAEKDRKKITESMLSSIRVPSGDYHADKKYQINNQDDDAGKAAKLRQQKAFLDIRRAEVLKTVDAMDASYEVCGTRFEKGKPVSDDEFLAALAKADITEAVGRNKIDGLVKHGLFDYEAEGEALDTEPEADATGLDGAPKRKPGRPRKPQPSEGGEG